MAERLGTYITGLAFGTPSLVVENRHLSARYQTLNEIFAGDYAQNDTLFLAMLPAHAVLSSAISRVQWTALGSSVTLSIGLADNDSIEVKRVNAGVAMTGKTALFTGARDVATAGTAAIFAPAIADRAKPLWDLAGLSADPGVALKVIATLAGANPASGTLHFEQGFTTG